MRKNDLVAFTQESQKEAAEKIEQLHETKHQTVVSIAREGLKLVEEDPELY